MFGYPPSEQGGGSGFIGRALSSVPLRDGLRVAPQRGPLWASYIVGIGLVDHQSWRWKAETPISSVLYPKHQRVGNSRRLLCSFHRRGTPDHSLAREGKDQNVVTVSINSLTLCSCYVPGQQPLVGQTASSCRAYGAWLLILTERGIAGIEPQPARNNPQSVLVQDLS